jgi:LysM repeat protein
LTWTPIPTITLNPVLASWLTPGTPTLTFVVTLEPPTPELMTPGIDCVPRADWMPYIIQPGDTLFSIARQASITLEALQTANCITDPGRIFAGQRIVIPPGSVIKPLTGTPQQSSVLSGVNVRDCDNARARITSPLPGTAVQGAIIVAGTAAIDDFGFYKLELRFDDGRADVSNVGTYTTPVQSGMLGRVDTGLFQPGIYWLQLTVVTKTSNYPPPCQIRLVITR